MTQPPNDIEALAVEQIDYDLADIILMDAKAANCEPYRQRTAEHVARHRLTALRAQDAEPVAPDGMERRPYAYCCAEGGGDVKRCDCVNKDHGFALYPSPKSQVRPPQPVAWMYTHPVDPPHLSYDEFGWEYEVFPLYAHPYPNPAPQAAAADGVGEGWRTIETAPQDGTDLLLFDGEHMVGRWQEDWTQGWVDHRGRQVCPLYWMPLTRPETVTEPKETDRA